MRTDALEPAQLDSPALTVVDVGGGTGFCTQGIVAAGVTPNNITLLDQSPQQLDKARKKADLQGVTILEGDAEDLPFPADSFDRYISAGSIECERGRDGWKAWGKAGQPTAGARAAASQQAAGAG